MPLQRVSLTLSIFALGTMVLSAQPTVSAALNAGDYSTDLAPGSLISIFGTGFTAAPTGASGLPLPTILGGASVSVSSGTTTMPVPLYYVSPSQINAQLPYGLLGPVSLTVSTAAGKSAAVGVTVVADAPKFFTISQEGSGFIVATHADYTLVSRTAPVTPGETIILYLTGLGAVAPPVAAGAAPGDGKSSPTNKATDPTSVTLDTLGSSVSFAGLVAGLPGLYQVNFTTPYDDKLGDAPLVVRTGVGATQSAVTVPVRANGLYWVVTGGKLVNGQTLNGVSGSIAVRHNNAQAFGSVGLNGWAKETSFGQNFSSVASVALTLKSGGNVVFDNNGIETGSVGSYYTSSPGFDVLFSMSNLASPTGNASALAGIFAGYFRLTAPTTVDQMTGYFEGPLNVNPPFHPENIYNTFRMNIFSMASGQPKESGNYTGDVFTSDTTPGTFSFSSTGVDRVGTDGTHIPIYRLVYTLKTPLTLPAGEYWFSHDVATPSGSSTTTSVTNSTEHTVVSTVKSIRPQGIVK